MKVPIPPYDLCSICADPYAANCRAYRKCMQACRHEPKRYTLLRSDLIDRAIGWFLMGFAAGWIAGGLVP